MKDLKNRKKWEKIIMKYSHLFDTSYLDNNNVSANNNIEEINNVRVQQENICKIAKKYNNHKSQKHNNVVKITKNKQQ